MSGDLEVETLEGAALAARIDEALPALAQLRIDVFRVYPYLYDGDAEYERKYLRSYAEAPGAVVVLAKDGARIVGAATGAPMAEQKEAWAKPLATRGYNLDTLFYCGESVLLEAYRGRGLGHAFFDERERAARRGGATHSCFCAVIRPEDDPRRPADYRPLDPFWRARGYAPVEGAEAHFGWREVGGAEEVENRLQVWLRAL